VSEFLRRVRQEPGRRSFIRRVAVEP